MKPPSTRNVLDILNDVARNRSEVQPHYLISGMSNIKTCQIFSFLNEEEFKELIFQMVPRGPEVARILEAQYSNTDDDVFDLVQQIVSHISILSVRFIVLARWIHLCSKQTRKGCSI